MQEIIEDVVLTILTLALVFCMKNYVMVNAEIPSGSMENTILIGDRIIGNRLAYKFDDPKRGDIVIFKAPENGKELYIKRLIGMPGEKIQIINGLVYINDSEKPLEESYLPDPPSGTFGPFYVPEGCYFMMGDNRDYSSDSRVWEHPYIPREQVVAKAFLRYYPLNRIKLM